MVSTSPNNSAEPSSNNTKRRLQRMLEKPPSGTARMTAHVVGDPPLPFGEWRTDELVPALATVLLERMTDMHEDAGAAETKFVFTFLDDDGRCLQPRKFELRSRAMYSDDPTAAMVTQLDGSDRASTQLAQGTALALARLFMTGQQQATASLCQALDRLSDRLARADERGDDLRDQRDELVELVTTLRTAQADVVEKGEPMSEAQQKFFELCSTYLPVALSKLAAS
jgi:hypothetical protein